MKKCDEIQNMLIDGFYDRKPDVEINEHIENCPECRQFRNNLIAASEKLDFLEFEDLPIPGDLFNIIGAAEEIKESKVKRVEVFYFVLAALGIILPVAGAGIYFGIRILLYIQIILYINLPLIIIPLITNRKMKGAER